MKENRLREDHGGGGETKNKLSASKEKHKMSLQRSHVHTYIAVGIRTAFRNAKVESNKV